MKLICPKCKISIEGENINITQGVCQCPSCKEVFKIADFLISDEEVRRLPKPVFTKIKIEENYGETRIKIPKRGFTPLVLGITFFSVIWNVLAWVITVNSDAPFLFSFIFITIGIVSAIAVIVSMFLKTTLVISADKVKLIKDVLGFRITKQRDLIHLEELTQVVMYTQNYQPVYGIGLSFSKGNELKFGSSLKESERLWLIGELYELRKKDASKRL